MLGAGPRKLGRKLDVIKIFKGTPKHELWQLTTALRRITVSDPTRNLLKTGA